MIAVIISSTSKNIKLKANNNRKYELKRNNTRNANNSNPTSNLTKQIEKAAIKWEMQSRKGK